MAAYLIEIEQLIFLVGFTPMEHAMTLAKERYRMSRLLRNRYVTGYVTA